MLLTKIILLALSAVISFIFAGFEKGVFLINRSRIRKHMQAGNNKAHLLFNLKNEAEKFYMTVLLGSTITKGMLTVMLVLLLKEISSGVIFWSLFLMFVFMLFTFCDLLPKKLFSRFPEKLCLTFARSFQFAQFPFALFVGLFQSIFGKKFTKIIKQPSAKRLFRNRGELKKLMEDSDGSLNDEERNMINQVLRISERTLGQVAIPLNLSVTASAASPISSVVDLCRNHRIARVPIWKYGGGQRKVIGIVTLKTSLYREDYACKKPASEYMQPALFLPADLKVEAALTRMQRSGHWLAIVTSKSHKEAGVVALQDILNVVCSENPKK